MVPVSSSPDVLEALVEEFLQRRRCGQQPTLDEYVQKYPHLAAEIGDIFPSMLALEALKPVMESSGERIAAAPAAPLTQLGDYRIVREVGRGGMGVVYEAEQLSLGRRVALKVLPPHLLHNAKVRPRFEREARAAARLHHTNIVPVFAIGSEEGTSYYAMQFIQGLALSEVLCELQRQRAPAERTASDVLAERDIAVTEPSSESYVSAAGPPSGTATLHASDTRKLAVQPLLRPRTAHRLADRQTQDATYWQSVAKIGAEVASALQYAHEQGVFHRDIKPNNLMLDMRGAVWITDFGLAKDDEARDLTERGDVLGTLRYMPPEAFEGRNDARSDVYALGLTLYELLSLEPAFPELDRRKLIKLVTSGEPPRIDTRCPELPRDLATIVQKAIERDPRHRYQTAGELGADLERFRDGEPIWARRASAGERVARWATRNRALAGTLTVLATLLLAVNIAGPLVTLRLKGLYDESVAARSQLAEVLVLAQRREREATAAEHRAVASGAREADLRRQAEVLQAEAERLKQEAEGQREIARQDLYRAQLKIAVRLWETDRCRPRFDALLAEWEPTGTLDRRGWEWYYLHSLPQRHELLFRAHDGPVEAVRWSPDGSLLATKSASPRAAVRIWAAASGILRCSVSWPCTTSVNGDDALAWSPDGRWLALAGFDATVRIWDAAEGKVGIEQAGHDAPVTAVAWSRDGGMLASGDKGGTIRLWRTSEMSEAACWKAHDEALTCLEFDPSDTRLLTAANRTIKTWDLHERRMQLRLSHAQRVTCARFSPSGRLLAASARTYDGDRIRIWNVATGELEKAVPGHTHWVESLGWSPDGSRLATAARDNNLVIWDAAEGVAVSVFRGHTDALHAVDWRPDGHRLAVGLRDGTVVVWDAEAVQEFRVLGSQEARLEYHLAPLSWSPQGDRLAIAGGRRATSVVLHCPETGRPTVLADAHLMPLTCLAWSPQGNHIASADGGNALVIWDVASGKPNHRLAGLQAATTALSWSPCGRRLAMASADLTASIWDVETGARLQILRGHERRTGAHVGVTGVAWQPGGQQLATCGADGTIRIWDPQTGEAVKTIRASRGYLIDLAWSPDGQRLASCGSDNLLRIWDPQTATPPVIGRGHTNWVQRLAWSPDGARIATTNTAGTPQIKIWNSATGHEILELPTYHKTVRDLAWHPSGRKLAASNSGGRVVLYDATRGY